MFNLILGKLEGSGGDYIFKMIDIVKMYTQYLSDQKYGTYHATSGKNSDTFS